jgi:hypothetical protein
MPLDPLDGFFHGRLRGEIHDEETRQRQGLGLERLDVDDHPTELGPRRLPFELDDNLVRYELGCLRYRTEARRRDSAGSSVAAERGGADKRQDNADRPNGQTRSSLPYQRMAVIARTLRNSKRAAAATSCACPC